MRNAKTDLLRMLQKAFRKAVQKDQSGLRSAEKPDASRRDFLRKTMIGAVGLAGGKALAQANYFTRFAGTEQKFSVGILGAGVAGLHAAYILQNANIESTVFEASSRTGGRMYTATDMLGKGITTELGGEFVDSNHEDMLNLAKEFKLKLVDTEKDKHLIKQIFHFGGRKYTAAHLVKALQPYVNSIQADIDSLPETITYHDFGGADKWDKMSIAEYINSKGIKGWLKDMLTIAFTTEYGVDITEQSAINMLFLFDPVHAGEELFGESDERYKIEGGNQRVTDELTKRVKNIKKEYQVNKIKSDGKRYAVSFTNGKTEIFDYLICSLPFTILRNITLEIDGMSEVKKKCIAELGYGRNAKMFAGFKSRYWRKQGASGQVFSDQPFQLGWDSSQLQKGTAGGYTFLTGGKMSDEMIDKTVPEKVKEYLGQLEKIFPGAAKITMEAIQYFTGPRIRIPWPAMPVINPGSGLLSAVPK
ncbi:MAG: FAD-dependent oxidoreductase [Chitinophagaceae bacterium]|nr:FAD-dependent oxidoreductase [Chitinophagaceae bacterium]